MVIYMTYNLAESQENLLKDITDKIKKKFNEKSKFDRIIYRNIQRKKRIQ